MEAETCMRFAANVRESGFGLYSYLSSGMSSAIAISLRPTSFHCSMIAADGPRAGFGGSFGLLASVCATTGIAARNATAHNLPINFIRFISLSFDAPVCAVHTSSPAAGLLHASTADRPGCKPGCRYLRRELL